MTASNIFCEDIIVNFDTKKYLVSRGRFHTLINATIKRSLPDGYHLIMVQSSVSSESQYVVVQEGIYIYNFRISSHKRTSGKKFDGTEFITSNYKNFNDLESAIHTFLINRERTMKVTLSKYMTLLVLKRKAIYKMDLFSKYADTKFKRNILSLIEFGLVIEKNNFLYLTEPGIRLERIMRPEASKKLSSNYSQPVSKLISLIIQGKLT